MPEKNITVLADIPFKLDINDLLKQNHIKEGTDNAVDFQNLVKMAEKTGKPKILFKWCFINKKDRDTVSIDRTAFKSHVLRKKLDSIERVFAYVVTCGKEVDTIEIPQGDYLKEYWLDIIKQALLDFSRKYLEEHLSKQYNINKTASMQPGSGDISVWPIEQQKELFSLFGDVGDVEKFIGVRLTESFLMFPVKSISGIIFPTQIDFKSCELCYRKKCPRRRLPFNKDLWQSMQHDESERADQPIIKLNCGSIPDSLVESELFGYEKGAFSGAGRSGKPGKFEMADKRIIFFELKKGGPLPV